MSDFSIIGRILRLGLGIAAPAGWLYFAPFYQLFAAPFGLATLGYAAWSVVWLILIIPCASQHLCTGAEAWNSFSYQDVTLVSSTRFIGGRYGGPPEGAPYPNPRSAERALCLCDARCLYPIPNIPGGVDAVPRAFIDKRSDGPGGKAVAMPPRLRNAVNLSRDFRFSVVAARFFQSPAMPPRYSCALASPATCQDGIHQKRALAAIKKTRGRSPAPRSSVLSLVDLA
jgi:hypothetical protein